MLLAPLDRRGEWYRYHALFRELLYAELRSDFPEQVPELHRRTAWWLAQHGDDARALLHAVDAGAWDLAARLAGERWVDLLIRGEVSALRPLIERLPPEWIERDPELALAIASALLDRGDHAGAARLLRSAEAAAERVPEDREARFAVSFAALSLHVARLRETSPARSRDGSGAGARRRLEPGVVDPDLRALALVNLGIAELWTGEAASAARHLERGRGAAADAGRDWLVLVAVAHLALLTGMQHDFPARPGMPPRRSRSPSGTAGSGRGRREPRISRARRWRSCGTGSDDGARSVELARDALHGTQERPLRACLALLRSGVLARAGDVEAAGRARGRNRGARRLAAARGDPQFGAQEAMLRAELGDRTGALRALGNGSSGAASLAGAVVLAKLQLGDGDWEAARKTVSAWSEERETARTPAAVQAWLVEALALDAAADHDGAAVALERALERAEPGACGRRCSTSGARWRRSSAASCGAAPPTGRWSASCWRRSTAPTGATGRTRRS